MTTTNNTNNNTATTIVMYIVFTVQIIYQLCCMPYYLVCYFKQRKKFGHIPGTGQILPFSLFKIPFFAPFQYFGNYLDILKLSSKDFGNYPLYKLTAGNQTSVYLTQPEALRQLQVLERKEEITKPSIYQGLTLYGHNIVTTSDADIHKRHRRVVEKAFQEKNFKELVSIANTSTDLLLERIEDKMTLNLNTDFVDVTLDIIGKSNFGKDLKVFDPKGRSSYDKRNHAQSFYDSLERTNTTGIMLHMVCPKFLHPLFLSVMNSVKETRSYIKELIDDQRTTPSGETKVDLLTLLLESNENGEEGKRLTEEEIISDSFIFLFAGHETSATNLGHLFCELAKNPHIQDKCIEEIDRILENGRDFVYEDYYSFQYCRNAIKECLRLHSPTVAIPKMATKDVEICGYKIPKNTLVWTDVYNVHLDPQNWADPTSFNPDRFLSTYNLRTFLPFSIGSRQCVGMKFSEVETLTIFVRLLQRYRFELEAGKDPKTYYPETEQIITVKIKNEELVMKRREDVSFNSAS